MPRAVLDECARRQEAMAERLATLIESDAFWRPDAANTLLDFPRARDRVLLEDLAMRQSGHVQQSLTG